MRFRWLMSLSCHSGHLRMNGVAGRGAWGLRKANVTLPAGWRTQQTAGWPASPQSLGGLWLLSLWKSFPGTGRTRRWLGTASMGLLGANCAWSTWRPCVMKWWGRETADKGKAGGVVFFSGSKFFEAFLSIPGPKLADWMDRLSCSAFLRLWAHIQESAVSWRERRQGPPRWLALKHVMYQAVSAGDVWEETRMLREAPLDSSYLNTNCKEDGGRLLEMYDERSGKRQQSQIAARAILVGHKKI